MNREQIENWLDALIRGRRLLLMPLYDGDKEVKCIDYFDSIKCIHLSSYKMIPMLADALDLEWYHEDDGTDDYPHRRWFKYNGIEFFAQSQEDTDEDED